MMAALLMMAPEAFLLPPSSFVAQPLSTRQATCASSCGVSMMSLVPFGPTCPVPLRRCCGACDAVTRAPPKQSTLAADSATLTLEESKLTVEDAELAILGRQELSDEVALSKAQDAVLDAMSAKKGPPEIAELQAKVVELKV